MVSTAHLLAFALTAFVIIVIPGPSVLFVIGRALALGRGGALLSVLGNGCGEFVQAIGVAFGLAALVERSLLVFDIVKLGGATYLAFLGIQAIRHRRDVSDVLAPTARDGSRLRVFREGFLVGFANPKTIVFLAAILPQFADPARGHLSLQLLLLGAVFFVVAIASDSVWAFAAGAARAWFGRSPQRLGQLRGIGGVLMIGVGVRLALTGRND